MSVIIAGILAVILTVVIALWLTFSGSNDEDIHKFESTKATNIIEDR